jgi:hypothetical protein
MLTKPHAPLPLLPFPQ